MIAPLRFGALDAVTLSIIDYVTDCHARLASASGSARRRARRALVRFVECRVYEVALYGAPTVDDIVRSRLSRDERLDELSERASRLASIEGVDKYGTAARIVKIVETSSVAFPVGAGLGWCEWSYEHDGDSPTPHERARALRAAREGQS